MAVVDVGSIMQAGNQATQQWIDMAEYIQAQKAKKEARNQLATWNKEATAMLDNQQSQLDDLVNSTVKLSDGNTLSNYKTLENKLQDSSNYIYDADQFDSSKYNVEDYLNSNKDAILQDVMNSAQNTAAGAGLGHSSGAMQNMINAATDKSESLYNDAYNRMTEDRSFDYGVYTDFINQQQNKLNTQYNIDSTAANNLKSDITFDQQNAQNAYQMNSDITNSRLSLGNTVAQSKASLLT